ncbi:PatB family C-S lyase [Eubacteriales bacterium OttesenSCG-928-N13]|nr:PatB family C-S lyase [Eubacteriales bacterium OttesenSCG-928-N13]
MNQKLFDRFDHGVERRGTGCAKWDACEEVFGCADVLPLWVADMDFAAPEPVVNALVNRAQDGVYGYSSHDDGHVRAVCDWMKRRHDFDVQPEWVLFSPGVVSSLMYALKALTKPGDKVAIQTPVYGPFFRMAEQTAVGIYRNPLKQTEVGWEMDLEQLEQGFKEGVTCLMLCSPHNPVGSIWSREELAELVALCNRYNVGIVSDEIHMDFEMPGHTHTPILSVPGADRVILLASATKTFNLAGLRQSSIIVPNEGLRNELTRILTDAGVEEPNLFGAMAQTTAYREGDEWLDGLIEYLDGNRNYVQQYVAEHLPEIKLSPLEGTYLMWMDMRALNLSQRDLDKLMVEKAGVGLNSGDSFGEEGTGFVRMNIATPRRNVEEALRRIERAVHGE